MIETLSLLLPEHRPSWWERSDIDRLCERIVTRYDELLAQDPGGRAEKPSYRWIKRVGYELVQLLNASDCVDQFDLLVERITRFGLRKRGRKPTVQNIYKDILLAIFARKPALLSGKLRHKFGNELWWAAKHHVDPWFIDAFLRVSQPGSAATAPGSDAIDENFRPNILRGLKRAELGDVCGSEARLIEGMIYPADVMEQIAQFKCDLEHEIGELPKPINVTNFNIILRMTFDQYYIVQERSDDEDLFD